MTCEHKERTPEAVEMTLEDSLDHFLNCFTRAEMLNYWQYFQDEGDIARRCRMASHDDQIQEQREYIITLRNELDGKN